VGAGTVRSCTLMATSTRPRARRFCRQRAHARLDLGQALWNAERDVEKAVIHRLHGDADGGALVLVRQRRKPRHRFDHVVAGPV
jgi:hypothetical protein